MDKRSLLQDTSKEYDVVCPSNVVYVMINEPQEMHTAAKELSNITTQKIKLANYDGYEIAKSEAHGVHKASHTGKLKSDRIAERIKHGEMYDEETDCVPIAEPYINPSKSSLKGEVNDTGYGKFVINDYHSMYDTRSQPSGYQISDYKSVYDK